MERSLLLTALCIKNVAFALRQGTISACLAAQALEQLADEVEQHEIDEFTPAEAGRILEAIREENANEHS